MMTARRRGSASGMAMDMRQRCLANPATVRSPKDGSCGRVERVWKLQINSPFCKPVCKPRAAR